jgi:hypothetical protein
MDYPDYPKNGMMSGSPMSGRIDSAGKLSKTAAACDWQCGGAALSCNLVAYAPA